MEFWISSSSFIGQWYFFCGMLWSKVWGKIALWQLLIYILLPLHPLVSFFNSESEFFQYFLIWSWFQAACYVAAFRDCFLIFFIFELVFTRTEENFKYILFFLIEINYSLLFNKSILRMSCFIFKCVIPPDVRFTESSFEIFPVSFATYFKFECNIK